MKLNENKKPLNLGNSIILNAAINQWLHVEFAHSLFDHKFYYKIVVLNNKILIFFHT